MCGQGVNCQLGTIVSGFTATVVVTGLVASDTVSGTALVNQARVDSANYDSALANNSSVMTTVVSATA